MILKTFFKNHILRYIYLYDPGYFSLIYSIKSMLAVLISVGINYYLFGPSVIIWAGLSAIYVYFLNVIIGDKSIKFRYLVLFIFLNCLCVFAFNFFATFGVWLALPVVILSFIVGISSAYSIDLQKVLTMVLINGLVACIYIDSNIPINQNDEILTIFIGGVIGIIMQFFVSVGKYGKFTKKNFPVLLFDLELMIQNITHMSDYIKIRNQTLDQINNIKYILSSKAGKIKDPHLIKNTKRTLFYLYRIEEIYHSINSIHYYFNKKHLNNQKPKPLFYEIQDEIINNLKELEKMFYGSKPVFVKIALEKVLKSDASIVFINSIRIIYNKLESFRRGGEEEAYLEQEIPKKSFKDVLSVIKYSHPVFRYSIKYCIALGIAVFIARYLNINHGIWIALASISVMRPNVGSIKDIGKDYFLGTFLGLVIGVAIVLLFGSSIIYYPLFFISVFMFIYLRIFPYSIWACSMIISFVMLFGMLKGDFLDLMLGRLSDILIAFGIVFATFWLIWPKYSSDELMPNLKNTLCFLEKLLNTIYKDITILKLKQRYFIELENQFLIQYNLLSTSLNDTKKENKKYSSKDIENFNKSIDCIDLLNQNTNKLYDYLLEFPSEKIMDFKEIFENDIKLIFTRYEMLQKAIEGVPYYFKQEKDGRFLATDENFNIIIDDIFELQNKLYIAILSNIKH